MKSVLYILGSFVAGFKFGIEREQALWCDPRMIAKWILFHRAAVAISKDGWRRRFREAYWQGQAVVAAEELSNVASLNS